MSARPPPGAGPWRHLDNPALVAHRGYALHYPENTIVALSAAVACGARFLEFDIQLSADRVPVLCHDPDLERIAGVQHSVLDQDWRELRRIRASEPARLGDQFASIPLSRLRDAVQHLNRWPATVSFVEIKRHSVERFGVESTVDRVLEDLAALRRRFVLLSFDARVVAYAQSRDCPMTGWVLRDWDEDHRKQLTALRPDYVFCNQDKIAHDDELWPGRWHWVLYEVQSSSDAQRWRDRGAAMIESMTPGELLDKAPFVSQN